MKKINFSIWWWCIVIIFVMEALSVSPENRLEGELIDQKWVRIDLMMGFW